MSRAVLILANPALREKAIRWVQGVPDFTRLEFKPPKRTLPQNDKMWAMLTEISQRKLYHGLKLKPEDWKKLFLDALKREMRMVPNLDGNGFVNLNTSSSDLGADEMSDLIEILYKWGVENGVAFSQ